MEPPGRELGTELEPEEDEPEGEDGRVLLDPLGVRSRVAPDVELEPLSQPYRPVTATAIGRRTKADFFNNFIREIPVVKKLRWSPYGSNYRA
jgi:hypothetical protein